VNQRYLPVGASSYYFLHSGYRLQSSWFEVCNIELGDYLRSGGFSLWRDFGDHPDARGHPRSQSPSMYRMTRTESLARGGFSPATASLFNAPAPRFGFAPAEQRVLLRALLGETNREIASELGISVQTVNKASESAIRRIEMIAPCLFAAQESDGKRGGEKRRHVLDYLRYHMEELRPYRASAAAQRAGERHSSHGLEKTS
jgi:DNA-binding CsgD family transcriptional regulator